jgi:hypothetical protein
MSEQKNNVWRVYIGEKGYQLPVFNSQKGPYPPEPDTEGYIAIGWPAVGDMNLYKEDYADFASKYAKVYPDNNKRVLSINAGMIWNFAYVMKENDWVICPSSATGYLLVGQIIGEYIPDFHDELGFYKASKEVYLHLRKVRWLYVVPADDPRYSQLNKFGVLTVVQPDISIDQLKTVLNSNTGGWSARLKEETRDAFNECFFAPDGFLHMKNFNDSFGKIYKDDLINKKWLIQDKKTDAEYLYASVDELIAAGWAVD